MKTRKNESPVTRRMTTQSKANVILQVAGQDPIFVGTVPSESALTFAKDVANAEVGSVYVDDAMYSQRAQLRANPVHPFENEFGTADYALGLMEKPQGVMRKGKKTTLLPTICTVGYKDEVTYPISYKDVENLHIYVAAANLAVFYPRSAKMLPTSVLREFAKERNVTPEFVKGLNPQDRKALANAASMFSDALLRGNTKLEQSKVPSVLGIGTPSDIAGYNFAPTSGAKGLNLMNAASLVGGENFTELKSFRDIILEYLGALDQNVPLSGGRVAKLGKKPKGVKAAAAWEKKYAEAERADAKNCYALEVGFRAAADTLEKFSEFATCCPFASKDCTVNCLFTAGKRITKRSLFEGVESRDDESSPRLLSGYMHTAFLANPYYFLRLLIHALYNYVAEYKAEVCAYNAKADLDPSLEPIDIDAYITKLPPPVRLNVYSDYIWELIYSDMFKLFDTSRPKRFEGYRPASVMFYDYTKIPGRWSTHQRKQIFKAFKLSWDSSYAYNLPKNYHLTFSYSGEDSSYRHSQIGSLAGQNSTFVFSTTSITHATVIEALKSTQQQFRGLTSEDVLREINRVCSTLEEKVVDMMSAEYQVLARDFKYRGQQAIGQYWSKEFILPTTYVGGAKRGQVRVVSGDLYDIRYLDDYMKSDPSESLIVGLGWKSPRQLRVTINDKTQLIEPAVCSLVLESDPGVEDVDKGVGFAIARYNLGRMFELKKGDVKKMFSVFITAQRPDQQAVNELMADLAEYGEEAISGITFNTETGLPINTTLGGHNLEFVLVETVNDAVSDVFGNDL